MKQPALQPGGIQDLRQHPVACSRRRTQGVHRPKTTKLTFPLPSTPLPLLSPHSISSPHSPPAPPFLSLSFSYPPLHSLRLEIGLLKCSKGDWESNVRFPAGSGTDPQPVSNLVHFSYEIWHLVAIIRMIFLINDVCHHAIYWLISDFCSSFFISVKHHASFPRTMGV